MKQMKGDFISFSFNNIDSSELGIIRTSSGDRYNIDLSPELEDKVIQIPGGDGSYYFGSNYSQKEWEIPIAFDSLTEKEFRRLNSFFNDKKIHDLIFYECPYKVYKARISDTPQLEYICFDWKGERIYKGEGVISFVCYNPFAYSRGITLEDFTGGQDERAVCKEWDNFKLTTDSEPIENKIYFTRKDELYTPCKINEFENDIEYYEGGNINEWAEASGIFTENQYGIYEEGVINLYNPGDLYMDYLLYIPINESTDVSVFLNEEEGIILKDINENICIDSKYNLIRGFNIITDEDENEQYIFNNKFYNNKIILGSFFKIPLGKSSLTITGVNNSIIKYKYIYY